MIACPLHAVETSATITTDDGDKVDHGFTVLDIAKHAMCTYVASLDDDDWVCVACYASEARMVISWTACTQQGKADLFEAIKSLKEEGSTNLTDGIATGMKAFEESLPPPVAACPGDYALLLAVATDGQPSSGTEPAGGASYADFVSQRAASVAARHGPAAVPSVVAIGLGNDLDSKLLHSFSDTVSVLCAAVAVAAAMAVAVALPWLWRCLGCGVAWLTSDLCWTCALAQFLHIPDPGSVGPFMVNLLAATRATAGIPTNKADAVVANRAVLRLSNAAAVASVPGFPTTIAADGSVEVALGSLIYDQPRHVLVVATGDSPPLEAELTIHGAIAATACAVPAEMSLSSARFDAEVERTVAVCSLQLHEQRLAMVTPTDDVAARLAREGARIGDVTISLVWNDECDLDLHVFVPSGEEISYNHKKSACGGELDVDSTQRGPPTRPPAAGWLNLLSRCPARCPALLSSLTSATPPPPQ